MTDAFLIRKLEKQASEAAGKDMVMCCLCFDMFSLDELNRLDNGNVENVCKECAEREAYAKLFRIMAGWNV